MGLDNKIFHSVFEYNINKFCNNVAVECDGNNADYVTINKYANSIANLIIKENLTEPGGIVAVFMSPGPEYIASILGVMKAGRIFMPLSASMPAEVIKKNLIKTKPALIIRDRESAERSDLPNITESRDVRHIEIDRERISVNGSGYKHFTGFDTENPAVTVLPDDPCYLIFTSGSTGEPKAILGKHKSLSHFVHWERKEFAFDLTTRIPLLAPVTFDVSFRDIFVPLLCGGRVVIPDAAVKNNYKLFAAWLDEKEITALHIVPSLLRILMKELGSGESSNSLKSMKYVLSAGEPLYGRDVEKWREIFGSRIELVNLYGPSETVLAKVFNRFGDASFDPNRIVPLGKPISNASILILDEGKLCDIGAMGEIHIKTPFMSAGYYNSPELNEQSFIVNPLTNDASDLIYKTGDMGRYLPDRQIEYVGRTDRQVKVYGNRVELGEIEYALNSIPEIEESVIVSDKNHDHEARLLAYYKSKTPIGRDELRARLSASLPDYMLPAYFICLESFPLNFNGKINKKALPKPEDLLYEHVAYVAPATQTEKELAELWSESLGLKRVGVKNSYLEFGGNSLTAIKLISSIYKKFGAELNIRDLFENGSIESIAKIIDNSSKCAAKEFPRAESVDFDKLSAQQKRVWIESQFKSQSVAYNIPSAYRLEGEIDIDLLEKALNIIIERHEILRTAFVIKDGEPRQVVQKDARIKIARYRSENPEELINRIIKKAFDLSKAPLIDCSVIETGDLQYVFVFNIHHLITDGWSLRLMVKELNQIYRALRANEEYKPDESKIQYRDYAYARSLALESEDMAGLRKYWLEKLAGELAAPNMPLDFDRPSVRAFTGGIYGRPISGEAARAIDLLSEKYRVTKFALVASLINTLIAYYTGRRDILIGTVTSGRDDARLQDSQGFFSNTVVLRNEVSPDEQFSELVSQVKDCIVESMRHQDYPFEKLLGELNIEKDPGRNPLFDIMLIYRDIERVSLKLDGTKAEEIALVETGSRLDMGIEFIELPGSYRVEINFDDAIYKRKTIESFIDHFERLILSVFMNPEGLVGDYDILDDEEINRALALNYNPGDYDTHTPIYEQFSAIARRNPNKIAVIHRNESMTYGELDEKSDAIAAYLTRERDTKRGDVVAVYQERGVGLIASLLGALKASAAYMPLDPGFPAGRTSYMLDSCKCSVILTKGSESLDLPHKTIDIGLIRQAGDFKPGEMNTDNAAYIIFTSGTTGNPKGVSVSHKGFLNSIHHQIKSFGYGPEDRALQFASQTFDGSLTEIFLALLSGATLVIADRRIIDDTNAFTGYLVEKKVNRAYIPPSYLSLLGKDSLNLQTILSAGEAPVAKDLGELSRRADVYNVYGPTEASCTASFYKVWPSDSGRNRMPIGKPVANTNLLIMNRSMRLMPQGLPGEIFITGDGVALGYVNCASEDVFLRNPYRPEERMYKTGDIGRIAEDGNIEFLGRCDNQTKINGYRIEPEEIENVINSSKLVKRSVVAVAGKENERRELVAFVILKEGAKAKEFEQELKTILPRNLQPSAIVYSNAFPATPNGKIDRNKLLEERKGNYSRPDRPNVVPRTETQKIIAGFIKEILKIERVNLEDNFFRIGGHSLAAIQLLSKINKEFRRAAALSDIFSAATIEDICENIDKVASPEEAEIAPAPESEFYEISHAQKRIYIISRMENGTLAYNSPSAYVLRGDFKPEAFSRAVNALAERHEAFRTSFHEKGDSVKQHILGAYRFETPVIDLRKSADPEHIVNKEIEEDVKKPFDLSKAPLMRIKLYRLRDDEYFLYLNIHHIIADGWSIDIVARELNLLYNSYVQGVEFSEKVPEIQYKDFALWQRRKIAAGEMESQKKYWLKKLSGELAAIDLPIKKARPPFKTYAGKSFSMRIPKESYREYEEYARERNISMFAFFTTALKALLHRYTNQEDIIIGGAVAGRTHRSLDGIVGLFSNTIVLRDSIKSGDTFGDALNKVNATISESLENQDYPFDLLVEDLSLTRTTDRGALFDIALVFQHANYEKPNLLHVETKPMKLENGISKFEILFSFVEENGGLTLDIDYNSDIYSDEFISRMPGHLFKLIDQAVSQEHGSEDKEIGSFNILTTAELQEYEIFNDTEFADFSPASIPDLFRKAASKYPEAVAIVYEEFSCDYARLDALSDSIAQFLINSGITKGEVVAAHTRRDERFAVLMLGIMKSGAVYLPIDEKTPPERMKYILENSSAKLLITSEEAGAGKIRGPKVVLYSDVPLDLPLEKRPIIEPEDISYIIYTSGTTGDPKGILVSNVNLINTILHQIDEFKLDASSAVMQFYSTAFDASMLEAFDAFFSGAKLVITNNDLKNRPDEFLDYINKHSVSLAFFPPSFLSVLDKSRLSNLKTILTGMEPPIPGDAAALSKYSDYYNIYGPTETTVICAFHKFDSITDAATAVPIGKPMRNYKIYICNDSLQIQPKNIVGEICIEGMGVTSGYVGDKCLTEEKYVQFPSTGKIVFRSGDLGRINEDGNIIFSGRKDKQVKIRGYRIEIGEIKTALERIPGVKESYVDAAERIGGAKELVAYYTFAGNIDGREIFRLLRKRLPDYMVPGRIIPLEKIPTTANGKVDKKALPDPFQFSVDGEFVKEATTEMERRLVELWREALGYDYLGVAQNFFMLGGDSIKAIRLIALAKQKGLEFDVKSVFQNPTIEELAPFVKEKRSSVDQTAVSGIFPLAGIQKWFFENQSNSLNHFNQAFLLKAKVEMDIEFLRAALEEIAVRHDALRMIFYKKDGEFVQENLGTEFKPVVLFYDLTSSESPGAEIENIGKKIQSGIDIANGPLLRAALLRCADADRLLIVVHHLVIDGVSWRILFEDLNASYSNLALGYQPNLPAKTDSFGKWSLALREYMKGETYARALDYWKKQDFASADHIPIETSFGTNTFDYNEIAGFSLSVEQTAALLKNSTGINEIALAALAMSFNGTFGVKRLSVLLEGHGREEVIGGIDVSRTVGWFTSAYPVFMEVPERAAPIDALKSAKRSLDAVPNNGFDYLLIKYLTNYEDVLPGYEPQVSFNYLGQFKSDIEDGLFTGSEEGAGATVSERAERMQDFIINAIVERDRFELFLSYNRMRFGGKTVRNLLKRLEAALVELTDLSKSEISGEISVSKLDVDIFSDDAALDDFLNSL